MGTQNFQDVNKQVRLSVRKSMQLNLNQIEQIRKENNEKQDTIKEEDEEKKSINSFESNDSNPDKSIKKRIKGIYSYYL